MVSVLWQLELQLTTWKGAGLLCWCGVEGVQSLSDKATSVSSFEVDTSQHHTHPQAPRYQPSALSGSEIDNFSSA